MRAFGGGLGGNGTELFLEILWFDGLGISSCDPVDDLGELRSDDLGVIFLFRNLGGVDTGNAGGAFEFFEEPESLALPNIS